jgi:hypothetical protein
VPARGRADEAAGDLRQRRLAGSVGSQEPDDLALGDVEVDPCKRALRAVPLLETAGGERGAAGYPSVVAGAAGIAAV